MTDSFFRNDNQQTPASDIPGEKNTGSFEDDDKSLGFETGEFDTEEGRMAAVMAYIPFLCFVPLLNMRENKEARFHARQGVMLFLIELLAVLFLIDGVSFFVFRAVLVIAIAVSLAALILTVQGKSLRLPFLGNLADKAKL